jgi:hypothetical protein
MIIAPWFMALLHLERDPSRTALDKGKDVVAE